MTDIKDLLGRAFDDEEPPLGIDRDEVFRAGRQQVRRRHRLATGGVVAAVVAAIVGAAVLTDFVEITPDKLPPADQVLPAPPGPRLPLAPTSTPAGTPPLTDERASELTVKLHDTIGNGTAVPWPGDADPPRFRVEGANYVYESDVVETDGGEGVLQVMISYVTPGTSASCDSADRGCVLVNTEGHTVARRAWTSSPSGEQKATATVVLADGTKVSAVSSNYSRRMRDASEAPSGKPALDVEELTNLVTQAKFSVR